MFARKDIEHDVLSEYQRRRRNLKKASAESKPSRSQQPRTLHVDTGEHAAYAEGSVPTKSPSSEYEQSYTYTDKNELIPEGRTGSSDKRAEKMLESMDQGHEVAAGKEAPYE